MQAVDAHPRPAPGSQVAQSDVALQYRPAIDGLRAVAVLGVFFFHLTRQWLPGGFIGVDVFFVISGFLITSILLREYRRDSFSLWKFYQRRIARLAPALFTVAIATLIGVHFVYLARDRASVGAVFTSAVLSFTNIKYMFAGKTYFAISPDSNPFLHFWSLSVEEQFYVVFPAILLVVYCKVHRHITAILGALCLTSLLACIVLTYQKPEWGFYFLPARAWELLAGSILASTGAFAISNRPRLSAAAPMLGLALVAISLFTLKEGSGFPGYKAIIPVLGTAFILGSSEHRRNPAERILSTPPLVFLGRMSYSLYLWHWPIFCLVDYQLYFSSPWVRAVLKITLSAIASTLCYLFIESPGRVFLNRPSRRRLTFAALAVALLVTAPLGIALRNTEFLDAFGHNIAKGGILANKAGAGGPVVLMGDSLGSTFGLALKDIAKTQDRRLNILSEEGIDPLPLPFTNLPWRWPESLAFLKQQNTDTLFLICNFQLKTEQNPMRLGLAVSELKKYARRIVLLTQPPRLPEFADRDGIRNGHKPPFREDPAYKVKRTASNALVKSLQGDRVVVIDIEPFFTEADGSIRFTDSNRHLLYFDDTHLSEFGADLIKPEIVRLLNSRAGSFVQLLR